jgi:RNA recognition motif-containing protein
LRGPPRKPKQSGHALWVGNLPPGANVIDLKDHFSREATTDILSVFLISKSNCAFVNYKTEESCSAAMTRFHDSRFQGVRLVCRLRRTSVNSATGISTGPAAASWSSSTAVEPASVVDGAIQEPEASTEVQDSTPGTSLVKDRFFVVKSLTVEDLELSVRNGVWATQSHNEEALNKAYEVREETVWHVPKLTGI